MNMTECFTPPPCLTMYPMEREKEREREQEGRRQTERERERERERGVSYSSRTIIC